jgi:hypothetical protein
MPGIVLIPKHLILKNKDRLFKADPMLFDIGLVFPLIPGKNHVFPLGL